jgi:uncharacterized protein (TIGR02117 family)
MILRLFRLLPKIAAAVFALAVLYLGAALALGAIPVNRNFQPMPNGVEIAVCSNGVHTDFVLPVKTEQVDWTAIFLPAHYPTDVVRFDHIGIGWGDLDFYRSTPSWADFDTGIALRALTGLGPAALHVQYRPGPGANEDCRRIMMSISQYLTLTNYIVATIASTEAPAAPGYGATDLFYAARGRFGLFKSCNVWVGNGLKESGLPTGLWTPFSFQLLSHL